MKKDLFVLNCRYLSNQSSYRKFKGSFGNCTKFPTKNCPDLQENNFFYPFDEFEKTGKSRQFVVFYKIDGSTANINDMTNVERDFYSSIYPQQPHKIAI